MNKKISFPIAIIIIVVCAVLAGLIVWQYKHIPNIDLFMESKYCKQDSDCSFTQCCGCASSCKKICSEEPKALVCECVNNQCVPKTTEQITITTDKTEYEQGEAINYTVKNLSDHPIWFPPYLVIEKKLGGGYSTLPCLGPGMVREAPQPIKIESGGEYNSSWNQIFCDDRVSKNVTAPLGIYRIRFLYSDEWSIEYPKSVYSNEFTIKYESGNNPIIHCGGGSCKCMKEKECEPYGGVYIIPTDEGECSANSDNKMCCCPGV